MGQKRSFDEDCLQELSFKQPKQLDSTEKATSLLEINRPSDVSHKTDISGDALGDHCHTQSNDDGGNAASDLKSKEFKTSAPGSWGTSTTMEEDMGSRTMLYSSVFPELFEFSFPRRNIIQFEDVYSSLLNSSPRKEVSVGPDHQADIPIWDPDVTKKHPLHSTDGNIDYTEEFMMGSCVIPMPEMESSDVCNTIVSKLDCNCLDGGFIRCMQQHVKEAREELKDTIGLENFVNLGFLEMGEEVSSRWTEEEQQLFHEVIYTNPMLHGRNFWVHLSTMFPSRSKAEIVSYYFNVFMLRRRAAQNRSSWLEIDSDDDEWKGIGGPFGIAGEDEKSAFTSFINQDVHVDHGDGSHNEYDDDDDDDDNSSSNGNGNGNDDNDHNDGVEHDSDDNDGGDLQVGEVYATENMEEKFLLSKKNNESSLNGHMSHQLAKSHGSFKELLDVQKNSCTSCEIQPPVTGSHHPINERAALQGNRGIGAGGNLLEGYGDGSTDKFGCQYTLESCDSKVWDVTYPIGLMTSLDLLPTCNMMEEIFGPCNWNKSSNDKSVS